MCRVPALLTALMTLLLLNGNCWAQYEIVNGVFAGSGSARVERPAQRMRMSIEIAAQGSGIEQAIKALQERLDVARDVVVSLGAVTDSVKIASPRVQAQDNNRQQQMLAQMRRSMGRNRAAKRAETAPPVTVVAKLTAEWELDSSEPIQRLVAIQQLQNAVKEAKLAGEEAAQSLSPEEQELLEEASFYEDRSETKTGEPTFIFTATISEEEQAATTKTAFANATTEARRLAEAADASLGELVSLRTFAGGSRGEYVDSEDYYGGYQNQMMRMVQEVLASAALKNVVAVAGKDPEKLVYSVTVQVGYDRKK